MKMEEGKLENSLQEASTSPILMDTDHDPVAHSHVKTPIKIELTDLASSNVKETAELDSNTVSIMSVHNDSGLNDLQDANIGVGLPAHIVLKEEPPCTANPVHNLPCQEISSLSAIANYGSDSYDSDDDDNSNCNAAVASAQEILPVTPAPAPRECPPTGYRTIQPSSEDSDSDSSKSSDDDSSSSSSTDSSNEAGLGAKVDVKMPANGENVRKEKRTGRGGEIALSDLPPIEDLQISMPENTCQEMGFISSIVDQQVVVQAKANFPPLNLDTVLFLDHGRRPLGSIFDVLGQVSEPLYTVRFNSADHVKEKNVETGMAVFCAPHSQHTNFVFMDELLKLKATDSGWDDNEPPPDCLDFSDDEAERNSRLSSQSSHSNSMDWDLPPRKRVNSFERRMNERNLRKSALPPEPQSLFTGFMRAARARRGRNQQTVFSGQPRASRPSIGPVFPSPNAGNSAPTMYQPRPVQQAWDVAGNDQASTPVASQPPGMRAGSAQMRGYCFPPPSSGYNPFCMGLTPGHNPGQAAVNARAAALAMAYSMGASNSMYPAGYPMHNNQRQFPVMLRPASFGGSPGRYDTNSFAQSMPFNTPPPAFPPCFPSGPPQPPMRGQPYNPMFSGLPMFNPGFPPPQIHPRGNIYPVAPPPPPRGGV